MAADWAALTRQVKEASDIVAVVESYLSLSQAGKTFKAICPFHNDTRPSLDVNPQRQSYRCWSCNAHGDVFSFVQEFEKVDFIEARRILADRAGIRLDAETAIDPARTRMLAAMRWAADLYQRHLLDDPDAQRAREYVGERGLTGKTVQEFGLGYAPAEFEWLVRGAKRDRVKLDTLVEVGLIAPRQQSSGFYDRFRDRVIFPIRDVRGQPVGFGGRILPPGPTSGHAPKYYNSTETPLFSKSEVLYGLDLARRAAGDSGFLAVVEGYTDVMMAHQCGVPQVVATMGTALTAKHVTQLRRYASRVVLVFDADAGGSTGVDRALELFVSQDVDLAIATLPEGLDPCDFLERHGGEAFAELLRGAANALDFKLDALLAKDENRGVEGTMRVVEGILGILAGAPVMSGQAGQMKRELVVTRLTRRLGVRQETVWKQLSELTEQRRRRDERARLPREVVESWEPDDSGYPVERGGEKKAGPAPKLETELLEVLLAEPALVARAVERVKPEEVTHPGLRKLYQCLCDLQRAGDSPDLDNARARLAHPALVKKAWELQERGLGEPDRPDWFRRVAAGFERRKTDEHRAAVRGQLSRVSDHESAVEILRKLQSDSGEGSRP